MAVLFAVHNFKLNIFLWEYSFITSHAAGHVWNCGWRERDNWADLQCWHFSQACLTRGMVCLDSKPGKFALTNVYLCVQAKSNDCARHFTGVDIYV